MGDEEDVFEALPRRGRGGRPVRRERECSSRDAQVCRQIRDQLDLVLGGELDDPSLEGVCVLEVRPAAGMSAVCVRVGAPAGASFARMQAVQARLCSMAGRLRCEAAAAIHRKRTPALRFEVVPMPE